MRGPIFPAQETARKSAHCSCVHPRLLGAERRRTQTTAARPQPLQSGKPGSTTSTDEMGAWEADSTTRRNKTTSIRAHFLDSMRAEIIESVGHATAYSCNPYGESRLQL